jgi:hypothetical protein
LPPDDFPSVYSCPEKSGLKMWKSAFAGGSAVFITTEFFTRALVPKFRGRGRSTRAAGLFEDFGIRRRKPEFFKFLEQTDARLFPRATRCGNVVSPCHITEPAFVALGAEEYDHWSILRLSNARECSRLEQQLIAARSCLEFVLCSERRANALLRKSRGMDSVMAPPRAVIVPEVMVRVTVDGELIGNDPIVFEVMPRALQFVVGKR